jgi:hypothetical protein
MNTHLSLETTVNQILDSRRITRQDQHLLMSLAFSQEKITERERSLIDRVFERLQQGILRVVD